MTVESNTLLGLYISFPLYIALISAASVASVFIVRRRKEKSERLSTFTSHYLGGRAFGPFITMMTCFASLFSGYTVVGVPNEAYNNGFLTFRWLAACNTVVFGYMGTGPRLRQASLLRNHKSPADFITDRYGSQIVRYTTVCLQVFPSWLYLFAQLLAISNIFEVFFGVSKENPGPVLLIAGLILLYEWMGGLSTVALTDTVQGFLMVAAFLLVPIVMGVTYGGWPAIDLSEFPRPDIYQVISSNDQYLFFAFACSGVGGFTLPHLLQRTYSATSMQALKYGYAAMASGAWLLSFVGVYIGTMGIWILRDQDETPQSPFVAIIEAVMDEGSFHFFCGLLLLTASIAGIMSTADSLLIAISQLLGSELVLPFIPDASPCLLEWIGRGTSLLSMGIAVLFYLTNRNQLGELATVQFGMSVQIVPLFLLGLYVRDAWLPHAASMVVGCWTGLTTCLVVYYAYDGEWKLDPGTTGLAINLCCSFLVEVIVRLLKRRSRWPAQPKWDKPSLSRFGDTRLTSDLLDEMMDGIFEPFRQSWYLALYVVLSVAMLPLHGVGNPPLNEDGQFSEDWGPALVGGLPDWAFVLVLFSAATSGSIFYMIWRIPNTLSTSTEKEDRTSADAKVTSSTTSCTEQAQVALARQVITKDTLDTKLRVDFCPFASSGERV